MAQLNIGSLPQETNLETTDRILMWDATVTSASNIKYMSVAQLNASVTAYITPTVTANVSASCIVNPSPKSANNILTYSGTAWTAASTAPTNTVAEVSIQAGAVTINKIGAGAVDNSKIAASGIDASKLTTGTLPAAQVPSLDAGKITTGTFTTTQIPSLDAGKITTGTFSSSSFIPNLPASKITTGQLAVANGGTGASTAVAALTALSGYGGPNDAKPGRRIFIQSADPNTTGYTMVDGDLWFQV